MTATALHLMPMLQGPPKEDQSAADAAWDVELARRKAEIVTGRAKGVPAEELFALLNLKQP